MSIISYGRSALIEKITLLVKDYNSHTFNAGRMICGLTATDAFILPTSTFQRDYWKRTKPDAALSGEKLYFMKDETSAPVLADAQC